MMTLTCAQLEALLPELLDGDPSPELEAAAAAHLATCDHCRLTVDDIGRVRRLYRDHGPVTLPDEARRRIRATVLDAARRRTAPADAGPVDAGPADADALRGPDEAPDEGM